MEPNPFTLADLGRIVLIFMGVSLLLAIILLILTYRRLKNMHIPEGADFFTTLRHVPLVLVLILDLLDFGLDIFAAPVSWLLLGQLGLQSLQGVTVIEGLIPGTQLIPTLTGAWILARMGVKLPGSKIEGYVPPEPGRRIQQK